MSGYELVLLWFAWIVAGGSPGPATLSIAGTAMNTGRKAGVVFAFGILAGSAIWGLAAAFGLSALMLANAWLFEAVRYGGAAYLLFLAIKSLRSALSSDAKLTRRAYGGTAGQIFSKGMLIHLTNPKAILGWGSVFAITMAPGAVPADLFLMFGFLFSGSILVFVGYAFLFSTESVVAVYTRMRRLFETVFAAFFGTASLKILTARLE